MVIVSAIVVAGYTAYTKNSVYPMGGEVTIVDKFVSGNEHYIVIEQPAGEQFAQFTLSCNANDYNEVSVGNRVNCERYQSVVTRMGEVHRITPLS